MRRDIRDKMLGRYIAVKKETEVEGGFVRNASFREGDKSAALAEIRVSFEDTSSSDCINLVGGYRPVNYSTIGIYYLNAERKAVLFQERIPVERDYIKTGVVPFADLPVELRP